MTALAELLVELFPGELATEPGTGPDTEPGMGPRAGRGRGGLRLAVDERWHAGSRGRAGEPTLHVRGFLGRLVLGPLEEPERPGCPACAEHRMLAASSHPRHGAALIRRWHANGGFRRQDHLTAANRRLLAAIVAEEVATWDAGGHPRTRDHLYVLDPVRQTGRFAPFTPYAACPVCGTGADGDTRPLRPRPRPKRSPADFRTTDTAELGERVTARYADPVTGLVATPGMVVDGIFPAAVAEVPTAWSFRETAVGRAHTHDRCRALAVLEGLERYAGWHLGGGRAPAVRASFADLGPDAVDPAAFGLHEESAHARDGFPFRPYSPHAPLDWCRAYSLTRDRPVLVPYTVAHYGTSRAAGADRGFVYENSNGCALGGTLEEAILFGLLEVVERDSFLLTWYARLAAPEIDLDGCADRELRLMIGRFRQVSGRNLRAFALPNDTGIPAVCLVSEHDGSPTDGHAAPAVLLSAGAHLIPERAVNAALHELAAVVAGMETRYPAERERALAMLDDPFLVRHMDDHALLGALPEARDRFAFLLDGGRDPTPLAEAFATAPTPAPDLCEDMAELVGRCADAGLEVLVADHTPPELRAEGLVAVKVMVPGTLPMTFGHVARRIRGLTRLTELPHRLGFAPAPLRPDQINPHPHPFP